MSAQLHQPDLLSSDQPRKMITPPGLAADFALLGLQGREARMGAIRHAARRAASRIRAAEVRPAIKRAMLGELATSTYRLLDPRRRTRAVERIHLCVLSEADLELQKQASVSWFQGSESNAGSSIVRNRRPLSATEARVSRAGSLGASLVACVLAGSMLTCIALVLSR